MSEIDAQLEACQQIGEYLLDQFSSICVEHGIGYFLDCGTLLGAYRHQGWIPWDDDIDVAMFREDYETFKRIAPSVLPPDLELADPVDTKGHATAVPRVRYLPSEVELVEALGVRPGERQKVVLDIFLIDHAPATRLGYYTWLASTRFLQLAKALQATTVRDVLASPAKPAAKMAGIGLHGLAIAVPRRMLAQAYARLASLPVPSGQVGLLNHPGYNRASKFPTDWFEESVTAVEFCGHQHPAPMPVGYLQGLYGSSFMELPPPEQRKPHRYNRFSAEFEGQQWGNGSARVPADDRGRDTAATVDP